MSDKVPMNQMITVILAVIVTLLIVSVGSGLRSNDETHKGGKDPRDFPCPHCPRDHRNEDVPVRLIPNAPRDLVPNDPRELLPNVKWGPFDDVCEVKSALTPKVFKYQCSSIHHPWLQPNIPTWEPDTLEFVAKKKNKCLISFGEWVGIVVIPVADSYEKIFTFEPDPLANFELRRNVRLNGLEHKIHVFNECISLTGGVVKLRGLGNSGSHPTSDEVKHLGDTGVDFVADCISIVDILKTDCTYKIDVEAAELHLFDAIAANPPNRLHLSVHRHWGKIPEMNAGIEKVCKAYGVQCGPEAYGYFFDRSI